MVPVHCFRFYAVWPVSEAAARWSMCLLAVWVVWSSLPAPADAQDVRVRILDAEAVASVTLTVSERTPVHTDPEGSPLFHIRPNTSVTLAPHEGGDVRIEHENDRLAASTLYLQVPQGATTTVQSGSRRQSYPGTFAIRADDRRSDRLEVVNRVPLEQYVASVVASEYGLDDTEGAKAMAVVARTYALRGSDRFGDTFDHVDHTLSQVYRGLSDINDASRAAAQATQGEVLTYEDHLVEAVYFSSSGGHTANNEDVWDASEDLPYLRGRDDPYDSVSPHHTWSSTANRLQVLRGLEQAFGGTVRGFFLGDKTDDGRLLTMDLLRPGGERESVQANAFRLAVNRAVGQEVLRSTWFDARRNGSEYAFEGRGYGHGVGMSQWGAHGMAKRGHTYRDILGFYYQGASIASIGDVDQTPTRLALDEPDRNEPLPVDTSPSEDPDDPSPSTRRRIGW